MPYPLLDEIIAFPTDTVYGLGLPVGADPTPIYTLKGRPESKPLIHLVPSIDEAPVPKHLREIAEAYWPGPLTLILEGVGYRVPAHPLALDVLRTYGPLQTTSANLSGKPPARTAEEVRQYFPVVLLYVEDTGVHGLPSTIITDEGKILRQGAIPESELQQRLGQKSLVR